MPWSFSMCREQSRFGLRLRYVDVLTAYEDDASSVEDPALRNRAFALGRVLYWTSFS